MTVTLADLRKRAGLSQPEVAKKMGVSRTQVSRIEASYPNVMFPVLRRYMDAIEVEIRFFNDLIVDCPSDEVEKDAFRTYGESKGTDPTRGGATLMSA